MFLDFLVPIVCVVLDQITKHWASAGLKPVDTVPLLNGVFHLTYCENAGAAFSILTGRRWLLLVITVVLTAGVFYALRKDWVKNAFGRWSLRLILGGAVGNMIDRVFLGYVVDFFDFRLIHFPIFNVADVLLNVGVFMMIFYALFMEPKLTKKEKERGDHPADSGNNG